MTTRRRLVAALALSALAIVGLSACRSSPKVAAYVGDRSYTVERVEQIYADARTQLDAALAQQNAQSGAPAPTPSAAPNLPITRQDVVRLLVGVDLARSAAQAKGLTPPAVSPDDVVSNVLLPASAEYTKLFAEYQGYLGALVNASKATQPAEADLRLVHERLLAGGLQDATTTFEDFKANVGENSTVAVARFAEVRDALIAQAAKDHVVVNPRYAPADVPVLMIADQQGLPYPLLVVPLGTGSPAVVDATTAPAVPDIAS